MIFHGSMGSGGPGGWYLEVLCASGLAPKTPRTECRATKGCTTTPVVATHHRKRSGSGGSLQRRSFPSRVVVLGTEKSIFGKGKRVSGSPSRFDRTSLSPRSPKYRSEKEEEDQGRKRDDSRGTMQVHSCTRGVRTECHWSLFVTDVRCRGLHSMEDKKDRKLPYV